MRQIVITLLILLLPAISAAAKEEIPIWPQLAPGTEDRPNEEYIQNERIRKVYQPSLTVHLPPQELATGAGALIFPGGGYRHLAIHKEGHHTAAWLNTLGIAAFVLKYRLDQDEALQDAFQSIRVIRQKAEHYGIDPEKLGLIGFSAGGHLLLNTVSNSDEKTRPDFLVIMYPVIDDIDLETAFPTNASPSIIFGATDDATTPPSNVISVYQSLVEAKIDAELHLYRSGGHGFGLGLYRGPVQDWTSRCETWLEAQTLLSRDY